ncbi:MAG: ABC transporter permease [Alphaproteobacteria bacterium]
MSINLFGASTLLKKEVYRFFKVYHQTLFSPVVNIVLFLAVFNLSVGNHIQTIEGVDFAIFMSAGLIMMASIQNAFANSSSSFVMGKVMGHIVDYLIPPLGALELLLAFTLGAIIRGICVGVVAYLTILIFVPLGFHNFFIAFFYLFIGCMLLGLLGVLCGILSEGFDQMSAMTSYLITPLTFLSGTFYSTNSLPEFWKNISHFNPFFYMIDGFRYGITGHNDGDLTIGAFYLVFINLALALIIYKMFRVGYKIKQ